MDAFRYSDSIENEVAYVYMMQLALAIKVMVTTLQPQHLLTLITGGIDASAIDITRTSNPFAQYEVFGRYAIALTGTHDFNNVMTHPHQDSKRQNELPGCDTPFGHV